MRSLLVFLCTTAALGPLAGACSPEVHFADTTGAGGKAVTGSGASTAHGAGSGGHGAVSSSASGETGTSGSAGGATAGTGGGTASVGPASSSASSSGCTPTTCTALGAECGNVGDGCGGMLSCGTCPPGKNCGVGGANKCGCQPTTCAALNANCGTASDGCGGALYCGECTGSDGCGAAGTPNVCAPMFTTMCGGCPAGYGYAQPLYDQVCQPGAPCLTQQETDVLCARGNLSMLAGCNLTMCGTHQHLAQFPSCICSNGMPGGMLGICIGDP